MGVWASAQHCCLTDGCLPVSLTAPPPHMRCHVRLRPGDTAGVETAGGGQLGACGNRQHSSTQASAPRTHGRLGRPSRLALPAGETRKVQRDSTRRTSRQNTDPPAEMASVSAQKTLISNQHPTALHSNWARGLLEP